MDKNNWEIIRMVKMCRFQITSENASKDTKTAFLMKMSSWMNKFFRNRVWFYMFCRQELIVASFHRSSKPQWIQRELKWILQNLKIIFHSSKSRHKTLWNKKRNFLNKNKVFWNQNSYHKNQDLQCQKLDWSPTRKIKTYFSRTNRLK